MNQNLNRHCWKKQQFWGPSCYCPGTLEEVAKTRVTRYLQMCPAHLLCARCGVAYWQREDKTLCSYLQGTSAIPPSSWLPMHSTKRRATRLHFRPPKSKSLKWSWVLFSKTSTGELVHGQGCQPRISGSVLSNRTFCNDGLFPPCAAQSVASSHVWLLGT